MTTIFILCVINMRNNIHKKTYWFRLQLNISSYMSSFKLRDYLNIKFYKKYKWISLNKTHKGRPGDSE